MTARGTWPDTVRWLPGGVNWKPCKAEPVAGETGVAWGSGGAQEEAGGTKCISPLVPHRQCDAGLTGIKSLLSKIDLRY